MSDYIETIESGDLRVRIVQDTTDVNPREDYDHIVNVITADTHLGHYLEVDADGGPLQEAWDRIAWRPDAIDVFIRYAEIYHGATVIERHDGPRTLWYITAAELEEHGIAPEHALNVVEGEIREYRDWAEGDVFGLVVEKNIALKPVDETDDRIFMTWDELESVWGVIGWDWAVEYAKELLEDVKGNLAA
ncbi:hypothetical protein SEA_YOSIF_68 [Streptomyces phage Yosif]|uniref:Uncharacterized protein n=1 Tax=Streptomyces phage Yosif TaxID=2201421 RepID=A0A2Z4QCD7_9CAUD|nr:hypothetical protein KGG71_gp68 [Streptomyces phage Yosif]AWY07632.1 hypothetical protein SEA_YOSIF_68 [Streptomyces phage Yosif]